MVKKLFGSSDLFTGLWSRRVVFDLQILFSRNWIVFHVFFGFLNLLSKIYFSLLFSQVSSPPYQETWLCVFHVCIFFGFLTQFSRKLIVCVVLVCNIFGFLTSLSSNLSCVYSIYEFSLVFSSNSQKTKLWVFHVCIFYGFLTSLWRNLSCVYSTYELSLVFSTNSQEILMVRIPGMYFLWFPHLTRQKFKLCVFHSLVFSSYS